MFQPLDIEQWTCLFTKPLKPWLISLVIFDIGRISHINFKQVFWQSIGLSQTLTTLKHIGILPCQTLSVVRWSIKCYPDNAFTFDVIGIRLVYMVNVFQHWWLSRILSDNMIYSLQPFPMQGGLWNVLLKLVCLPSPIFNHVNVV
jgi:hypothetical protein